MNGMSIIRLEQNISVSKQLIWQYLTSLSHMKNWWFSQIRSFEPKLGFKTRFTVSYEGEKYLHLWEVLEVIPQEKLVLDWRYDNHSGRAYAKFELRSTSQGTQLIFTSDVLAFFPNKKVFSRASMRQGWKKLLQEQLPKYVEKIN